MLRRFYHSNRKMGANLCKMLNSNPKKKWNQAVSQNNLMPSIKSLTKVNSEPNKRTMHRIATLNKLFMKNITDIMSTGTPSIDIVGRGIEISKVHVSLDLQRVKVFWVCKGNSTDEETEKLLNRISGPIRHELSILRLMGEVPFIAFVKDKQEARIAELERRLAIADFGEDYEPTDPGHLLKSEFTLATQLSPEVKAKLKHLEESMPFEEDPLPEMSHNVFGLDHHQIHGRLTAARKKTINAWNSISETGPSNTISYRGDGSSQDPIVDDGTQKQELAEFLMKKQIEIKKLYKERNSRDIPVLYAADQSEVADDDQLQDNDDSDWEEEEVFDDPAPPDEPVVRI